MPLFKSDAQRERERHNREMIDHAHEAADHKDVDHRQGNFGGQEEYYAPPPIPSASGPGGVAVCSQQQPTAGVGYGLATRYWDPAHAAQGHLSQGIPPASVIHQGDGHSYGNGAGRLTGKIEAAVGSVVGSQSLKAKGEQKQYEADSSKRQAAELSEAERLEREARLRRERAVAHGAHPGNLNPQGQNLTSSGPGQAGW